MLTTCVNWCLSAWRQPDVQRMSLSAHYVCSAIVAVVGIAAVSCHSACLNMHQICRTLSQGSLAECMLDDECDARCRRLSTDSAQVIAHLWALPSAPVASMAVCMSRAPQRLVLWLKQEVSPSANTLLSAVLFSTRRAPRLNIQYGSI